MWKHYIIAMLSIFSSVSTKSLETNSDVVSTDSKWRLLIYLLPSEDTKSSIEDVFKVDTELKEIQLHNHVVSELRKEKEGINERNAWSNKNNRHRLTETIQSTENEEYTTKKQNTIYKKTKKANKKLKGSPQKELLRHLDQYLKKKKLVTVIRRGLDIFKGEDLAAEDPCLIPGICRTQNGFAHLLHDILSLMLKFEISDFYLFCQILTDVIKITDFSEVLDHATDKCIREYIENFEMAQDRAKCDLVEYAIRVVDKSNDTVLGFISIEQQRRTAWQNLIYLLDDIIPKSEENIKDWNDIKTAMANFRTGALSYIEPTINYLLENLKQNLRVLNAYSKARVLDSFRLVCSTFKYHRYVHDDFMLFPIDPVQKLQMQQQENSPFSV